MRKTCIQEAVLHREVFRAGQPGKDAFPKAGETGQGLGNPRFLPLEGATKTMRHVSASCLTFGIE